MMVETLKWVVACRKSDIDEEDVLRFDHGSDTYAIYHVNGQFYASDGWCTHEKAHLADGFVLGDQVECPRHQGRFHVPTGKALCAPVCKHLQTHPVRFEGDAVLIGVPSAS
jgi:3-phenylpropionate/trans-cinnamate dioxygenase ferredoxin component